MNRRTGRDVPVVKKTKDAVVMVPIRPEAFRLLRTVLSWNGQEVKEYLSVLILTQAQRDLDQILLGLKKDKRKKET